MFCTPSLTGGVRKLTVHDNIVFVGDYDIFDKDVAEKLIYIITGSQTRIEYSDWEGFLYVRSNGVRLSIKDKSDYKKEYTIDYKIDYKTDADRLESLFKDKRFKSILRDLLGKSWEIWVMEV